MKKREAEFKLVVWDLDHTVWEGTLLEDKTVTLKSGIKEMIKELDSRGILHSIASKNNHKDAMKKLSEFGLIEYFLYPQINWNSKSSSIKRLADHLNIAFNTIIFIDDQRFERDEVSTELPEVTCIPAEEYLSLLSMPRLQPRFVTEDSRRRRLMYMEEMLRKQEEVEFEGTADKFLQTLRMKLTVSEAQEQDLKRAEELTVRTNQLNATGVTYSYEELELYRTSPYHKLYICELEDKYGSYGKIGLALVETEKNWHIKLLLMSCRVMSRGLGTIMLNFIMHQAKQHDSSLLADFRRTDRNKQMYIAYRFANFQEISSNEDGQILLSNDLTKIQGFPPYVEVIAKEK